ncbi:class I SAM-dependent methyltransferase [Actinomadura alba]|uniref:Methyltransferase domain-containing protein n=1 Tax=Actinomadura alba TaxID=406431 RepID=A0ABR7LTM8_9ACTN|nr:class I SAM-dependent methyltransferase [Actinomadura alba]MBC6468101.1 methyltransferase domain-containing protein [Actinomadura alba]
MRSSRSPQTGEVFDAAARDYSAAAALLWDALGEGYVERVRPVSGSRVLDACCGAGASAIPAARAVGPAGQVDAVDLAAGLVELGRRRAAEEHLDQVRFHKADVTNWPAPQPYDLVLCGYGIFFLPDMDTSARRLAGLLGPGGRFSVAAWAKGAMEDFGALLYTSVTTERPSERADPPARRASNRINTEAALADWMISLGLDEVSVHQIVHQVTLTPDNARDLVIGSGFRAMLHDLDDETVARVRDRFLESLTTGGLDHLDATSLVAVGTA